ncbi:MAG: TRAP transporter large permease subunit [Myxococcota bacterium]|nr:TRAP transporter large permease subunit [Myxococcota bacterium]
MSNSHQPETGWRRFTATVPVFALLLIIIAYTTGEKMHARLIDLGESVWPGYAQMKLDPVAPTCDPNAAIEMPAPEAPAEDAVASDAAPEAAAEPADVEEEDDFDLDDLMGGDEISDEDRIASLKKAKEECQKEHAAYALAIERLTPSVRMYKSIETTIGEVQEGKGHNTKYIITILLLVAALVATARREHIALRPCVYEFDHRLSFFAQALAHLIMLYSSYAYWQLEAEQVAAARTYDDLLHFIWMVGFAVLAVRSILNMLHLPDEAQAGGGLGHALLTVPLFTIMALISGSYFLFVEGYPQGMAVYIGKLITQRELYMDVGLYVWVGMLLKQTNLATLAFDIVRPWKLNPELLAFVVVAFAAVPTAYSGASGIFVIAAGAVIYQELRRSGARKQLALAATAMSGSTGVVLRPCLLVVIVASLNKQVTTDQLFSWGWKIYLLTAVLFFIVSLFARQGPINIAPVSEAMPESLARFRPVVPYAVIGIVIWAFYHFMLNSPLNEFTAAKILPIMFLGILYFDIRNRRQSGDEIDTDFKKSGADATAEASGHIGALLMLMVFSICLGGIVESSEVMQYFPQNFATPEATMSVLVVALVIIGMTMDPYGAVILVTASIANVAYKNGVDPVHFWMVVIVAFELGYLTPPVALNHLLTRQVVGESVFIKDDLDPNATFWQRHERLLLPMTVLAIALVLVAYVPFFL